MIMSIPELIFFNKGLKYMYKRLKQVREYFNLSQQEMADSLNLSKNGYWYYETGRREIRAEEIFSIIQLYNINANWLLTGEGAMFLEQEIKPAQIPSRFLDVKAMTLNQGRNLYLVQKFNGKSNEEMAEILHTSVDDYLGLVTGRLDFTLEIYDKIKSNFEVSIDDLRYDEKGLFDKLEKSLQNQKQTFDSMSAAEREEFLKFIKNKK